MKNKRVLRSFPHLEKEDDLPKLLELYNETKDSDLLNMIVEICYPMVDFVLDSPKYKKYDKDLLASYASIGLLKAIEDCKNSDVSTLKINIYEKVFYNARIGLLEISNLSMGIDRKFYNKAKEILEDCDESEMFESISDVESVLDALIEEGVIAKDNKSYYLNRILASSYMTEQIEPNLSDSHLVDNSSLDYNLYLKELRALLYKAMDKCCTELQKESIKKYFGFYLFPVTPTKIDENRSKNANYENVKAGLIKLKKYFMSENSTIFKKEFVENVIHNPRFHSITYTDDSSCFIGINEADYYAKKKVRK